MTFENFYESVNKSELVFDTIMTKVNIFVESAYSEFDINCKEAELKVLKESGNDDDLLFYEEAAKKGLVNKIGDAISKAYDAMIAFIHGIVEKVVSLFKGKENAIDKMKEASKNPALKSKKLAVEDVTAAMRIADESQSRLDKSLSKFKTKTYKESDVDEVNKTIEEYQSRRKKFMKAGAITISVGALIGLTTLIVTKLSSTKSAENEAGMSKKKPVPDNEETARLTQKVVDAKIVVGKSKLSDMTRCINSFYHSVIRREVSVNDNRDTKNESADIIDQSSELDSKVYLENLTNELFNSDDNIPSDTADDLDQSDQDTHQSSIDVSSYLDDLDSKIDDPEPTENNEVSNMTVDDYLDKIDPDNNSNESSSDDVTIEEYLQSIESSIDEE